MKALFLFIGRHQGLRLLGILGLFFCCAPFLPHTYHQFFYSISLAIKTMLLWVMPLIVCFYIAHTVHSFKRQAPLFLITLLVFEGLSNFTCLWYAYGLGTLSHTYIPFFKQTMPYTELEPLFTLPWAKPSWYSVDKACLVGIGLGFLALMPSAPMFQTFIHKGKKAADFVLIRLFSKLIPIFIIGFIANLYVTGLLGHISTNLSALLPWLIGGLLLYNGLLFFISAGGSLKKTILFIKNLLPAGLLALSSGCSLSTMPWTIQGTRKNLNNPDLADAIIPATTNIQQIGDCITNAFLSYIMYVQFMGYPPALSLWLSFCIVFTLARFTTAAVLGGAIFIMLPIYENYLHFTPSMVALMLAFNVILDPVVTSNNVLANGALCGLFEKVWQRISTIQKKV